MKKIYILLALGLFILVPTMDSVSAEVIVDNDNAITSIGTNTSYGGWSYQNRGFWGDSRITTNRSGNQSYSWYFHDMSGASGISRNYYYAYVNDPNFTANVRYAVGTTSTYFNSKYFDQNLMPVGWIEVVFFK